MRAVIFIIFIALLGFLVYTQFIHPPSEEQLEIRALQKEFDLAMNQYIRALKYTSGVGMDLVGDIEMAIARIKKVRAELDALKSKIQDEEALKKAASLEEKIKAFIKKNDIR